MARLGDLVGRLITGGGGSGVALGQAKVFAREGMKVVIADIRQDHLDEAMSYFRQKNASVHAIKLDITDRAAFARAADEAEKVFGPVQLLCNTAGVFHAGPIEKATYEDWDWQLGVNLGGMINGIQTFVPRMIAQGQGGHIVNTASMSAFVTVPTCAIYTTSKFAVRGLSESLHVELDKYNIGVSVLCPGTVNTNIHESLLTRPARLANSGWHGPDPEVFKMLKAVIEPGLDPVTLAEHVLKAVRDNDFYILPYPEFASMLEENHKRVMRAIAKPDDDPEMAKRLAAGSAPGSRDNRRQNNGSGPHG